MVFNATENAVYTVNSSGPLKMIYSEWGAENDNLIICIHGLTGNGQDFNAIAPKLAGDGYRVIAPDLPGRGRSGFADNPEDYRYRQYLEDIGYLLAHLGVIEERSIDWLGVSLGGLLGFRLAAQPASPIRRMVVNDIGPHVPEADLNFIKKVLAKDYAFENFDEFTKAIKALREPSYGKLDDKQWRAMAQTISRKLPDGRYTFAFDPAIREMFDKEPIGEKPLWPFWDAMDQPTLVLRGETSTIFPPDVAQEMTTRGPGDKMTLKVIKGCGHVPPLVTDDQIDIIRDWLKNTPKT